MTEETLAQLERDIAVMKSAGCINVPVRITTIEKMIASERRHRKPATVVSGDTKVQVSVQNMEPGQ